MEIISVIGQSKLQEVLPSPLRYQHTGTCWGLRARIAVGQHGCLIRLLPDGIATRLEHREKLKGFVRDSELNHHINCIRIVECRFYSSRLSQSSERASLQYH